MPVRGGGDDIRVHEVRAEQRDPPPGYRRRKEPSSQSFEQGPAYPDEARDFARASEPYTAYKLSEMEKQTIILEKAAPDQGFGIAVSGGLDNPHYETGDTSIIVSDVVERSPADGLLRNNDVILSVNGVNVEGVEHSVAVEALKNSGYSVKLVILRRKPSTASSSPTSPSIPAIQEPPPAQHQRALAETSKEPRNVMLSKHPEESYGLSLGSILFVKDLDQRGPAGRDGQLELGDVILKINDKRVDDISRPDAVNIMRNSPERLDLVVLRNKDVPPNMPARFAGVNETVSMTRSTMVESANNGMNGQDLIAFKQGQWQGGGPRDGMWDTTLRSTATYSISSAGKRSDERERDIDARRDKKFHGEPHLVSFHRTGSSLGIQVAGGNAVGIFANAIKDGSPAQVAGLRVGDQILSANDIEFKDITREEAVLILLSLPEEVSLLVQYKKSVYDKSKDSPGDSFYVKAQFHYGGSDEDELSFRRGEVFHVLDTMNGGTIGSWRGQRVLQSGAETEVGIIPNKCRAEQLAIAQDLEMKKGVKLKSGTLKRKDGKSNTPKKKQYQAADQLDETSFQLDIKYPAYERVVKQKAGYVRPVVLLGPIADICRDKLMVEYPEKFTSPATFGRFDANKQSGIKLSAVRDNIASGKHSLLDVTPEGVEMLNFVGLEPIVVFMQPNNKQLIKDLRHDLTNKTHSARFVKKLYDQAETLSIEYPYLFTAVISLERNNKWYTDCIDLIKKQQEDPIWLPETLNQQQQPHDDEVVLQMPRRSVGYDMDQSGLDLPGDLERKPENYPNPPDEEIVVAASASMEQSEQAPVVQAFSVTPEVSERDWREEEEREFQRKQEQEREFQEREFLRKQDEEREFQRKQEEMRVEEEEREHQRRQAEADRERDKEQDRDRRDKDEYERKLEQREYERRQYEENRRGYDGDEQRRDERKPYIPPGVKVLPGTLPPVVLKKTDSGDRRSPRDESYQDDARPSVQLRHVERDSEAEQYDERIGVKVSDLFDIGKDIQAGGEYMEDGRRVERSDERRYRSDSDDDEAGFSRDPRESHVTDTQDVERRGEQINEELVRTIVKPVEAGPVDFEDVFSSQQNTSNRTQTTTEYKTSYQVTKQARNTVVDTRGGRRVEGGVFSEYYPGRSRAKIVNIDEEKQGGYVGHEEPQVKMEYENRVSSEPPSYDRRPPPPNHYDDEPPPNRRPPPPSDDQVPNRPKPYSNVYPRPFGTQSSAYYSDSRRTATDYNDGRQYNGEYQQPVPESATYQYGSTAYRNPATDYDDARGDATRSSSEI